MVPKPRDKTTVSVRMRTVNNEVTSWPAFRSML
jgi:hypothetical protein